MYTPISIFPSVFTFSKNEGHTGSIHFEDTKKDRIDAYLGLEIAGVAPLSIGQK